MCVLREDVRSVSGIYFLLADATELINESGKITYMLYLKSGTNFSELHKCIRMFAIPYRMVLIDEGDQESIGFVLFGDEDEREELDSMMEWIALSRSDWMVINCQKEINVPIIIGHRIPNNLFHAKRLALQGEILD